jgi:lysophospholipase L1-like esterase
MKIKLCYILLILFTFQAEAQENSWLYRVNRYDFIRYDLNELHHFGNDPYSEQFYSKLEKLVKTGEGKINIVQIGGSHIQAGTFSGQIRNRLQQMNGNLNAGWGFMFPYRMARTNSPFGYYIRYSGYRKSNRNVQNHQICDLGVGGIAATTRSEKAELTVLLEKENQLDYRFNKVRLFYEGENYSVDIDSSLIKHSEINDGFIDFELKNRVDSLTISIQKNKGTDGEFVLYGLTTGSAPNGIVYHSIGVNGADVPAFLECKLLEKQLAQIKPDLVILGLGINDAYGNRFSQNRFEENYTGLIQRIRKAAPETAIIFTTNNDSYLYRRYVNRNGEKVKESMFRLAEELETGVWDMYSVMGGLNSIVLWERNRLAQSDKVHFTREGYLLLGDLFFNALARDFEEYLQTINELTQLKK